MKELSIPSEKNRQSKQIRKNSINYFFVSTDDHAISMKDDLDRKITDVLYHNILIQLDLSKDLEIDEETLAILARNLQFSEEQIQSILDFLNTENLDKQFLLEYFQEHPAIGYIFCKFLVDFPEYKMFVRELSLKLMKVLPYYDQSMFSDVIFYYLASANDAQDAYQFLQDLYLANFQNSFNVLLNYNWGINLIMEQVIKNDSILSNEQLANFVQRISLLEQNLNSQILTQLLTHVVDEDRRDFIFAQINPENVPFEDGLDAFLFEALEEEVQQKQNLSALGYFYLYWTQTHRGVEETIKVFEDLGYVDIDEIESKSFATEEKM